MYIILFFMVNYKEKIQQNYLSHRFIEKLVDALLVRNFPYVHRNRLRMSNSFEHITKEICRHTLFAQVMESPKIFFQVMDLRDCVAKVFDD